jgi:pimeloyl-ACP methyl ester carboxylesterase
VIKCGSFLFSGFLLVTLIVASCSAVLFGGFQFAAGDPEHVDFYQQAVQTAAVENFTVIVLPDTQFYSASYPVIFDNQTRWVVGEAENMNVVFVTHEGDIVDSDVLVQWQNANHSMSMLDDHVPWGVLPGNHDGAASGGSLANYDAFFGCARFSGESWYGGGYLGSNANNYEFFSGGGDDYLIFHFRYNPSDAVLAWANQTIANYPNRRVIVTTHSYLNVDGSRTAEGTQIWNRFVAPHADQVFLVLCGHMHGEARRTDVVNGHSVYQILADYQSRTNGGNGWLRTLEFRPEEDKIYVKTFSPYLNSYESDADSEFTLNYEMTGSSEGAITISLQSPVNGTTTMDNMPDFRFIATSQSQQTFNCSLWLQNSTFSNAYGTKNDVANGSLTTMMPSSPIPNGDWWWWLNCTDGSTSSVSEKRRITINVFRGDKTFTSSYDASVRYYWLDLPDNFDNSTPTPLVFFLHGYGGSRLSYSQKYPVLRQTFQNHTWIVAAVDCRTVSGGYQNWYAEPSRQDITDVLNTLRHDYYIDSDHVHIMGNSMGGGGALKYAMFNNEVIASLVDIHGITNFTQFYIETTSYKASLEAAYGGTPSQVPEVYANESALGNEHRFMHTPVMMLHGTADDVVSVSQSRNLNQSLSALGYTVKYIEVPGVTHDAQILISGREMEIFNWFNSHPLWVPLVVSVGPTQAKLLLGQSQTFSASVTGGSPPYSFQWYLDDTAVSGAASSTWTFTPRSAGHYRVYLNVTDGLNFRVQSNVVSDVLVCSAYLLLTVDPAQGTYVREQSVTFTVNVFNELDPVLGSSLTLTVSGPSDYGYFDVQPVSVAAGTVGEYTFDWVVPDVAGTYFVEVELVPALLTAYDAVWLDAA